MFFKTTVLRLYFTYGGYWDGNSDYVGSDGYYWSSVVSDSDYAYFLYFDVDDDLGPQVSDGRSNGISVRCVAR